MPIVGIAGEDIPINSLCSFGGSNNDVKLVTLITDNNHPHYLPTYICLNDIKYGDYLSLCDCKSISTNLFKNNKEYFVSDKVATGTTYASSFVTIFAASFSFNEMLALGGLLVGVITMVYNILYRERVLYNEREYRKAILAEIKNKGVIGIGQETTTIVND